MIKLLKLQKGLYKFLAQELKKKRTLAVWIDFAKKLTKLYLKELLQLYKNFLNYSNPNFYKHQKEVKKYQQAKKDVINALRLLKYAKDKMKKAGISRQRIRRFFLDLSRDEDAVNTLINDIMKEM
jgi:esterase/lipase